jgi:hypothetical protein
MPFPNEQKGGRGENTGQETRRQKARGQTSGKEAAGKRDRRKITDYSLRNEKKALGKPGLLTVS